MKRLLRRKSENIGPERSDHAHSASVSVSNLGSLQTPLYARFASSQTFSTTVISHPVQLSARVDPHAKATVYRKNEQSDKLSIPLPVPRVSNNDKPLPSTDFREEKPLPNFEPFKQPFIQEPHAEPDLIHKSRSQTKRSTQELETAVDRIIADIPSARLFVDLQNWDSPPSNGDRPVPTPSSSSSSFVPRLQQPASTAPDIARSTIQSKPAESTLDVPSSLNSSNRNASRKKFSPMASFGIVPSDEAESKDSRPLKRMSASLQESTKEQSCNPADSHSPPLPQPPSQFLVSPQSSTHESNDVNLPSNGLSPPLEFPKHQLDSPGTNVPSSRRESLPSFSNGPSEVRVRRDSYSGRSRVPAPFGPRSSLNNEPPNLVRGQPRIFSARTFPNNRDPEPPSLKPGLPRIFAMQTPEAQTSPSPQSQSPSPAFAPSSAPATPNVNTEWMKSTSAYIAHGRHTSADTPMNSTPGVRQGAVKNNSNSTRQNPPISVPRLNHARQILLDENAVLSDDKAGQYGDDKVNKHMARRGTKDAQLKSSVVLEPARHTNKVVKDNSGRAIQSSLTAQSSSVVSDSSPDAPPDVVQKIPMQQDIDGSRFAEMSLIPQEPCQDSPDTYPNSNPGHEIHRPNPLSFDQDPSVSWFNGNEFSTAEFRVSPNRNHHFSSQSFDEGWNASRPSFPAFMSNDPPRNRSDLPHQPQADEPSKAKNDWSTPQLHNVQADSPANDIHKSTYYPIRRHLIHPQLLGSLLQYLTFYEWLVLNNINKKLRTKLTHTNELKEEVLDRYLRTIGYLRWTWDEAEPLTLSLRDLSEYMRGVSVPTHQYARIAEAFLHSRSLTSKEERAVFTEQARAMSFAARAYSRVVIRLRLQADAVVRLAGSTPAHVLASTTQPYPPSTYSHSSSRVPSPASSVTRPQSYLSRPSSRRQGYLLINGISSRTAFNSPIYHTRRAPLLRVFVPSQDGNWLSDANVVECEAELKRAGIAHLLQPGDAVWDAAVGDENNAGRMVWDGTFLLDLDYTYSMSGELPPYLPSLAFSPSYFHKVIRISGNPIVYIDIAPWGEYIHMNMQLLQDKVKTETPQGNFHTVVRWVHRSKFEIVPPSDGRKIPIQFGSGNWYIDRGWYGTVVVEAEGTNEGLADLQDRCKGAFPQRVSGKGQSSKAEERRQVFKILRERSKPGEIWIRTVSEKERMLN